MNVAVAAGRGTQTEASFAADPTRPALLVGALGWSGTLNGNPGVFALYASADGGARWRPTPAPALPAGVCFYEAPRVGIDRGGRELVAFLASSCNQTLTPYLLVSSRAGLGARWSTPLRLAPRVGRWGFDDGPSLALDPRSGRAYLAWTRAVGAGFDIVTSTSADGGRTWSLPRRLSRALVDPHLASVAVGPHGEVYVAGIDAKLGLWIARSTDAARSFAPPRVAAPLFANPAQAQCSLSTDGPLPYELTRCIGPNPAVVVRGGRVFVVFADNVVFVSALAPDLKPLFRVQVNPTGKAQIFFPVAAADPSSGRLWACWYDTTFDSSAHRAWFTCSSSSGGRTWSPPERAAAVPTDPNDLFRTLPVLPALAASAGGVHAFWPDGRNYQRGVNVFTTALRLR